MKTIMCGTEQHEPQSELVAQLAQEIYKNHIIHSMLNNLSHIDFEVSNINFMELVYQVDVFEKNCVL